jgi:pimeloyl-ACP methyl ester carboxylesterase
MVEDVKALVTILKLGRFVLVGNSMGGSTAFMYAATYPDDVDRLVLVDTGPGPRPVEGAPPMRPPAPPPVPSGPFDSQEEAAATLPPVFGPKWVAFMAAHNLKQDFNGGWVWKFDVERVIGGFQRSAMDPRRWPMWKAVQCPTLVLRGANSLAMSQAVAEEMVKENPNAVAVVVPDAAHFIAIEQPAAFEQTVRKWLGV